MKDQAKVSEGTSMATTVLFVIYLAALCWILLLKVGVSFSYMDARSVNLTPFRGRSFLTLENILNAVIFVPLGIYGGVLWPGWRTGAKLFFFVLLSLLVEGIQYVFRLGAFDVTDILTNSIGGVTGFLICKVIEKAFRSREGLQKFINTAAALGTVFMILLLAMLKMNLLPVRYQ